MSRNDYEGLTTNDYLSSSMAGWPRWLWTGVEGRLRWVAGASILTGGLLPARRVLSSNRRTRAGEPVKAEGSQGMPRALRVVQYAVSGT